MRGHGALAVVTRVWNNNWKALASRGRGKAAGFYYRQFKLPKRTIHINQRNGELIIWK